MFFIERPSPNFDSRDGQSIDMIIIHYTDLMSVECALGILSDPSREVSSHYLVGRDGQIYRLVEDSNRAWHAGASKWPDQSGVMQTNINSRSIGIELDNPGHSNGYIPFTEPQLESLLCLLKHLCTTYNISLERVVGHEDIAPGRKRDPGEFFDWERVRAHLAI